MKKSPCSKLFIVGAGLFALCTNPVMALTIGNYKAITKTSGSIEITQLDNAKDLTVTVEIDHQDVKYEINQISNDSVVINLEDSLLQKKEVLIQITVKSEFGENNRLFSYSGDLLKESELQKVVKAKQNKKKVESPPRNKVVINTMSGSIKSDDNVEIIDGKMNIDITSYNNSVGYALKRLASANKMDPLIFQGDEYLHQLPLTATVTTFEDLYVASNKKIKQIYFDDEKKLVRIVGHYSHRKPKHAPASIMSTALPLKEIFSTLAKEQDYEPIILLGDEKILNKVVEANTINSVDQLALYLGENGGVLDIDDQNKLLRVRKKS